VTLAAKYALFALLATLANLATQESCLRIYAGTYALALAMAAGTLTGLVVKYELDKRFIFAFVARSKAHDAQTFVLYTAVGGATTLLFWTTEWAFHAAWEFTYAKYVGALVGLSLGYLAKYHLDKRFVFIRADASAA
jgi:putative flippase GtrA